MIFDFNLPVLDTLQDSCAFNLDISQALSRTPKLHRKVSSHYMKDQAINPENCRYGNDINLLEVCDNGQDNVSP